MGRIEYADVTYADEYIFRIAIHEDASECAHCAMKDACKTDEIEFKQPSAGRYALNDTVRVRVHAARKILYQVLIFIVPLTMLFAGIFAGEFIKPGGGLGIILGSVFFTISFVLMLLFSGKSKVIIYEIAEGDE